MRWWIVHFPPSGPPYLAAAENRQSDMEQRAHGLTAVPGGQSTRLAVARSLHTTAAHGAEIASIIDILLCSVKLR